MTAGVVTLSLNPQEFFREKITFALEKQNLTVSTDTEFYLVNLLCEFISPEKLQTACEQDVDILNTPMAVIFKKALEAPPTQQYKMYKLLGDTSLYISGYFQDYFNRKTFDISYYIALGSQAYDSVSNLTRYQQGGYFNPVFQDLAKNFPSFVEVVAEVADLLGTSGDSNLLAVYDRWTRNHSERLRKKLEGSGIHPLPTNTKTPQ